nr:TIM44-like domain-containing protein [uncultured Tolumonas sp.]
MRKFFSLLTIFSFIFSIALFSENAEARKFGGSKSFGRSYKTAPAQPAQPMNTTNPVLNKQMQPNKSGLMGGLLGGLLAGGLFAWLMGSGAFDGLQIFDILLMAGVAFLIFRFVKSRKTAMQAGPQPAYGMPYQTKQNADAGFQKTEYTGSTSFSPDAVPFDLPTGFDVTEFIKGACEHYRTLQSAWNENDFSKIQEYVMPELYNELKQERANYAGKQHTEVLFINAELVRADRKADSSQVSLLFKGRYRDIVEGIEEDINEVWHLERNLSAANAPWLIVGIENK